MMDCDDETNRLHESLDKFPDELRARLFLIGALAEPEILKREVQKPFEDLGRQLAEECCTDNYQIWSNPQFVHCADQIQRLRSKLRPWLFAVESSNG
ncbi:MAG: hypothetical protein JNL67_16960 [Planctomycetaceae bacterium]|nr:hypothetical protein [Planctomycetaceae bacterium]